MSQASDADELFEVTGNELRPIIGNNAGLDIGIFLHGRLDNDFNLSLCITNKLQARRQARGSPLYNRLEPFGLKSMISIWLAGSLAERSLKSYSLDLPVRPGPTAFILLLSGRLSDCTKASSGSGSSKA